VISPSTSSVVMVSLPFLILIKLYVGVGDGQLAAA
jgi:hypothetical protein